MGVPGRSQLPGKRLEVPVKGRCAALIIMEKLILTLLPDKLGVCRMERGVPLQELPQFDSGFYSVTRTADETSLVCSEELIPASIPSEKNFRIFKVEGPLEFGLTGILASLLKPLADAGIPVFTLSTYDTDYLMIKEENLKRAVRVLNTVATIIC